MRSTFLSNKLLGSYFLTFIVGVVYIFLSLSFCFFCFVFFFSCFYWFLFFFAWWFILTFASVDETLSDNSVDSYWSVLSRSAGIRRSVEYQWKSRVCPFKWRLLTTIFVCCCQFIVAVQNASVCGWISEGRPFKWKRRNDTFLRCCLLFRAQEVVLTCKSWGNIIMRSKFAFFTLCDLFRSWERKG